MCACLCVPCVCVDVCVRTCLCSEFSIEPAVTDVRECYIITSCQDDSCSFLTVLPCCFPMSTASAISGEKKKTEKKTHKKTTDKCCLSNLNFDRAIINSPRPDWKAFQERHWFPGGEAAFSSHYFNPGAQPSLLACQHPASQWTSLLIVPL